MTIHLLPHLLVWTLLTQGTPTFGWGIGNDTGGSICPTWFISETRQDGAICKCGSNVDKDVYCSEESQEVAVSYGHCMTYWSSKNMAVVGRCPYNSFKKNSSLGFYLDLPKNVSELNDVMCGSLNREGLLCGQCKSGFNPAVHSFDYRCLKCSSSDWGIFLSATLLPTTVVFLLVMVFRINANAPPLAAFVLFCNNITSLDSLLYVLGILESLSVGKAAVIPLYILHSIYGFWNLDFLTTVIPPYCLPGVTSSIAVLAVNYLVAFYPLLLVLLAYLLIRMHYYNFRPVVAIWKPFHELFVKLRRSWDPNASVINTFATFILLSYWKVTYVSLHLLITSELHTVHGEKLDYQAFYYDATQELFRGKHLPFGLLAVAIIATFVVLPPLFLCLYPTRLFKKFLWYIRIRGHGIVAFMDVFQGAYKDGTKGTRDWRFMSGAYFVLRILVLIIRCSMGTLIRANMFFVLIPVYVASALAIAILRPYKQNAHSILDSILLSTMALIKLLCLHIHNAVVELSRIPKWQIAVNYTALTIPLFIVGGFLCYSRIQRKCPASWKKLKLPCHTCSPTTDTAEDDSELPYRLNHRVTQDTENQFG